MIVNDIYLYVAGKLMEPTGFQTGTYSAAQFLLIFADVLLDFLDRTMISKMIVTQTTQFGISQYAYPDRQLKIEHCFIAGKYLYRKTMQELDDADIRWRTRLDYPRGFHEDGLPIKTFELSPAPNWQGTAYPTDPNLNNIPAQTGDWFVTDRNITTVGAQRAAQASFALTDPVPLVPNSAFQTLCWGCLARILGDDSENRDQQRQIYSDAMYKAGVMAYRTIMVEQVEQEVFDI